MEWGVNDRCIPIACTTGKEDCVFKQLQNSAVKFKP